MVAEAPPLDLTEGLDALAAELSALAEASERLPQLVEALLNAPLALADIALHDDGPSASGALKLRVRLQGSQGLARLVTAFRAVNADLGVVERELGHLLQSSTAVCDSATVDATGESGSPEKSGVTA